MAQCTYCIGEYILDKCVLNTVSTYLQNNPIECAECNLHQPHNCMYVWNTGFVIANYIQSHLNDPELFKDYYELFVQQGHSHILKTTLFNVICQFIRDPECIAQIIPVIVKQNKTLTSSRVLSARQYIIDFQGFKISPKEYIIREFCLVACDATLIFHSLLKLPCERCDLAAAYQTQVDWLTHHLHGLQWNTANGYTVSHIRHILSQCCDMGSIFYCKGHEKMVLLEKVFQLKNIVNLEDQGCPALRALNFKVDILKCTYHEPVKEYACALRNCIQLQYWLKLQTLKVVDGISTMKL